MSEQQISNRGIRPARFWQAGLHVKRCRPCALSIVAKWKECSLRDEQGQTLTLQMMKLADTFEGLLAGYVEAGKFANHKLDLDKMRDESVAQQDVAPRAVTGEHPPSNAS
jgi:hypothetical protein